MAKLRTPADVWSQRGSVSTTTMTVSPVAHLPSGWERVVLETHDDWQGFQMIAAMAAAGVTDEELAEKAGLEIDAIRNWKEEGKPPRVVAELLKVMIG